MGVFLDVRTAITRVEQALIDALSLAFQTRYEVDDLPALKAMTTVGQGDVIPPNKPAYVVDRGVCYRWKKFSTNAENLPLVVTPSDRESATYGRWEVCSSTVTYGPAGFRPLHRQRTGYAKAVQLWQGDELTDKGFARIFGQTPAFVVCFLGDRVEMEANHPRGLNKAEYPFAIYCFSRNYRAEWQSLEGSAITSENDADPGLFRMMGDVRYILAGCDLGLSPGVRYCDIQGEGVIEHEDLSQRRFVGSAPVLVRASWNIPDEDLVPIEEIEVQFKNAGLGTDRQPDTSNYVASGFRVNYGPGVGLTQALTPGAAYVNGELKTAQPGAHTFAASRDTYIDLTPGGQLVYSPVVIGAQAPAQTSGTLRMCVVQTDASDIRGQAFICDWVMEHGERFDVIQ